MNKPQYTDIYTYIYICLYVFPATKRGRPVLTSKISKQRAGVFRLFSLLSKHTCIVYDLSVKLKYVLEMYVVVFFLFMFLFSFLIIVFGWFKFNEFMKFVLFGFCVGFLYKKT